MQDASGYIKITQVKGSRSYPAVCGNYRDADTILIVPDIGCGAASHAASAAVYVPLPGCRDGHA